MFTARRLRLIAFAALASFAFAQAAIAAMGCATLPADAARGNVAVMPSGEPCDMMGSTATPLCMKHCAQEAAASDLGVAHLALMPLLAMLTVPFALEGGSPAAFVQAEAPPPILGPPPYLATLRLRV